MKWVEERNSGVSCINHACNFYCADADIQNCDAKCEGSPAIELCKNYIPDLSMIIESFKKENESLKCCGNCRHMDIKVVWDDLEYYCKLDMIDIDEFETSKYCDRWEYDGLTREGRMIK